MFVRRSAALLVAALFAGLAVCSPAEPARPASPAEPDKPAKADKPAEPAKGDRPPPDKTRHALLVGVTFYEHLPEKFHLVGPGNDVEMMRQVLVEKFLFSPDQIVTLSEKEGKEKGKDFYPTK